MKIDGCDELVAHGVSFEEDQEVRYLRLIVPGSTEPQWFKPIFGPIVHGMRVLADYDDLEAAFLAREES